MLALVAIFLPAWLSLAAVLPFWHAVRSQAKVQSFMAGVGASVVGLLFSVLYQPIWTSSVFSPQDFFWVVLAVSALILWRCPPWLLVLAGAVVGGLL